jgi:EAL domain-containing protein (putative c-di-GMP-specific phosphodiesterase class I)
MQDAVEAHADLDAGLHRALAEDEFFLVYQPQVDIHGRLVGAEALLRWQPRGQAVIPPSTFIPVAETSALIVHIGTWVLQAACRQLAVWAGHPATAGLRLSVNIGARQFRQPEFVDLVLAILRENRVSASRLKLEITESVVLEDVTLVIRTMKRLKEEGVEFAIDDFGTGYSSLAYLKRLPLDQLKIDQSFVQGIPDDPENSAIAQAIIALGQSLNLQVVAEGVESEAQRAFLAALGCDTYQGYLFGRPGPASEIERLVC